MVVVDVVTPELCVCRTADGQLLEGRCYHCRVVPRTTYLSIVMYWL